MCGETVGAMIECAALHSDVLHGPLCTDRACVELTAYIAWETCRSEVNGLPLTLEMAVAEPEALRTVFEIIGHKPEDIDTNFGHMLKAFASGTPPHGGIAWGFDRFLMLLQGEPNIREVIPFPKTGEGRDLMMNAPAPVSDKQLDELHLIAKKISK